jgi:drug/metabolite transporter (DMT)-like permease
MTTATLLLLLASACLHVVAHIALKSARDPLASLFWMLAFAAVACSPVLATVPSPFPVEVLPFLVGSAFCEALYYYAIARAYETGALSVVYPIARGSAPVLLLLWAWLILGERPSALGELGILAIALGLYCVQLPRLADWRAPFHARGRNNAIPWALLAGLAISLYTTVDRRGVEHLAALPYTYLSLLLSWTILIPFILRRQTPGALRAELAQSPLRLGIAGTTTLAAYVIVLEVMRQGAPASYVGAVREVGVVLATGIGVLWFGEKGTPPRLLGSGLVVLGVAAIRLWG